MSERIEYFSQEIKNKQLREDEAYRIVWDKKYWEQRFKEIAQREWRKTEINLISI